MLVYDVLVKPVHSEKSLMMNEQSKYTFVVNKNSNKHNIAKAITSIFSVEVEKVNIINVKGKSKFFKKIKGRTSDFKKAIVSLAKGQKIDFTGGIK